MTKKNSLNFYTIAYLTALFTSAISYLLSYLLLYELPFTYLLDIGFGYWFVLALKNAICLAILSLILSFVWAKIMLKDNFYHYDSSNLFFNIIKVKYALIFIFYYVLLTDFNDSNRYPITYTLIFLCIIFYSLSIYFIDVFRYYHDDEETNEVQDQNDQSFRSFRENLEKEKKILRKQEEGIKYKEEYEKKQKKEKRVVKEPKWLTDRKIKEERQKALKLKEEQKVKLKQEKELKNKLKEKEEQKVKLKQEKELENK